MSSISLLLVVATFLGLSQIDPPQPSDPAPHSVSRAAPQLAPVPGTYPVAEMDSFAADLLNRLQKQSFAENREYCGVIVTRDGTTLSATRGRRGRSHSCSYVYPDPDLGWEVLASYHTHASDDPMADGEVPSVQDLETDMESGLPGYVATPGGRLWRTDPARREVRLICAKGCVARDPRFVDCTRRAAGTRHSLSDLRQRQSTALGTCDQSDR